MLPDSPTTVSLDVLAQVFRYFGEAECRGYSPLYERLAVAISQDEELLALAATARHRPVPNVLLAAVHFRLLEGAQHPLRAYYPSVTGAAPPEDDPYPHFRDFCLEQEVIIRRLLETRLTQTNEVGRCAAWLPAFSLVAQQAGARPLACVEVGASAGLNLLWDRYAYDYGTGTRYGDAQSSVTLHCAVRGSLPDWMPAALPRVAYRLGLDLHPVDVEDPDEAMWLRALVWPEHQARAEALWNAIEIAKHTAPPLLRGDATDLLPDVLSAVPRDTALCVFHSFTLNQFSAEARRDFYDILAEHSLERRVYRLSLEGTAPLTAALRLHTYADASVTRRQLAVCHPHGQWLEWALEDD